MFGAFHRPHFQSRFFFLFFSKQQSRLPATADDVYYAASPYSCFAAIFR